MDTSVSCILIKDQSYLEFLTETHVNFSIALIKSKLALNEIILMLPLYVITTEKLFCSRH